MPPLVSNISLSQRRRYGIQKELKEKNLAMVTSSSVAFLRFEAWKPKQG